MSIFYPCLSFLYIVPIVSFFGQIFILSFSCYCLFCPFYLLQVNFQICLFCALQVSFFVLFVILEFVFCEFLIFFGCVFVVYVSLLFGFVVCMWYIVCKSLL